MERLYKLAGTVRSVLLTCQTKRNDTVDPLVRSALAETVENDREEWHNDFESIVHELERIHAALQESMAKEQFLDTRIRKYRKALEQRSKELAETPHEPNYEQRRAQLDHDTETLKGVQITHKDILIQCEEMRRKVRELEQKRDKMVQMDDTLQSFVESNAPREIAESMERNQQLDQRENENPGQIDQEASPSLPVQQAS